MIIEDNPNIPREGKGKEKGGRKQIEAGKSGKEYLEMLKKEKMYKGEEGMNPEAQIMYAIMYLEENNQVIDDYEGKGSASWQLGAYFPLAGSSPVAYWNRNLQRDRLSRYDPHNRHKNQGVRGGVRI